jgi:hypothetical protein
VELLDDIMKSKYVPPENMRSIMEIYEKSMNKDMKITKKKYIVRSIKKKSAKVHRHLSIPKSQDMFAGLPSGKFKGTSDATRMTNLKSKNHHTVKMDLRELKTDRFNHKEIIETSESANIPDTSKDVKV